MNPQTKQLASWAGKIAAVILPALVTSYFSYRTALVESGAKVATSSAHAEAGYEVTVEALQRLAEKVAELRGAVTVLQVVGVPVSGPVQGGQPTPSPQSEPDMGWEDEEHGDEPGAVSADDIQAPLPKSRRKSSGDKAMLKAMPESLGEAYDLKRQNSIKF